MNYILTQDGFNYLSETSKADKAARRIKNRSLRAPVGSHPVGSPRQDITGAPSKNRVVVQKQHGGSQEGRITEVPGAKTKGVFKVSSTRGPARPGTRLYRGREIAKPSKIKRRLNK